MKTSRKYLILALIAVFVMALIPAGYTDTNRLMLVRVYVDSPQDAAYLMNNFDESHNHSASEIELVLWPGDRAELDALGYTYDVVAADLLARDARLEENAATGLLPIPGPDREDYRRLSDYNSELKALAKKNPKLVKLFEMKRKSLEGRKIFGVEIAANVKNTKDGRPIFYMDAVHHAREWPASEYSQLFIYHLVEGFGKDKEITSLLKKLRVIIVPIVNVDGFHYTRETPLSSTQQLRNSTSLMGLGPVGLEGYWRKNRRSLTGETNPATKNNPDAYGIDNNRNYAYLWGDSDGGSSGDYWNNTYRGAAPFSEPETRNVRDIVLSRLPTGIITNHTYQASVLRAGGGNAPEDGILMRLGQKMADVLKYQNAPSVGYPTTGTTDDWAYAAMSALGFTIEHGRLGFHPPYANEVGAFWKEHMKAFTIMAKASLDKKYHSVLKGRVAGSGPAKLTVTKSFKTPLSPGNPTGKKAWPEKIHSSIVTNKNGSFEWHLTPSSRPYEKKDEAYTLTISRGSNKKTMKVFVDRGQVKNLGTIRL